MGIDAPTGGGGEEAERARLLAAAAVAEAAEHDYPYDASELVTALPEP